MKNGFTLIEIAVVILIIAIVASMGIPRFLRIGTTDTERFIARLNGIVALGAQYAQETNKVQKINFNFVGSKVELQSIDSKDSKRSIELPKTIEIKDFYINGKSQFASIGEKYTAYFLINPEGISQEVKINLIDNKSVAREIYLNPFTVQFRIS